MLRNPPQNQYQQLSLNPNITLKHVISFDSLWFVKIIESWSLCLKRHSFDAVELNKDFHLSNNIFLNYKLCIIIKFIVTFYLLASFIGAGVTIQNNRQSFIQQLSWLFLETNMGFLKKCSLKHGYCLKLPPQFMGIWSITPPVPRYPVHCIKN